MQFVFILLLIAQTSVVMAQETRVIINLSEQRVYLVERGKVILIAPIASGKPGWSTPTGNFAIISKDIDHRSRNFGSVVDGFGRIAILNATPATHVPAGFYYRPAPMPYYMEFALRLGCIAVTFQDIRRPTAVCGYRETLPVNSSDASILERR